MHTPLTWQGLTLLSLSAIATSAPLQAHKGENQADIWVTSSNTLNATIWHNDTPITRPSKFDKTSLGRWTNLANFSTSASQEVDVSSSSLKSPNGSGELNTTDTPTTSSTTDEDTDHSSTMSARLTVSWTGTFWNVTETLVVTTTNEDEPTTSGTGTASNGTGTASIGTGMASSGTGASTTTTGLASTRTGVPMNATGLASNGTAVPKNVTLLITNNTDTTLSNATMLNNTIINTPLLGSNGWNSTRNRASANAVVAGNGVLSINLVNKLASNNVKAYISGLNPDGALIMLGQSGQWVYPTTSSVAPQAIEGDVAIPLGPQGSTTPITLPGFISSARVWLADGGLQFFVVATPTGPGLVEPAVANANDPNAETNWGFVELTWIPSYGLYADISAVDFVGLPLGITLRETNGNTQQVLGLPSNAASAVCNQLIAQGKIDGRPWGSECVYGSNGQLVRVVSPEIYQSMAPTAFGTYFGWYMNDAWDYYSTHDLVINTQAAPGNVICRVQGTQLICAGDNRGYAKPTVDDIFGCNTGPFAILAGDNAVHQAVVPRLCAAIHRATLLIDGGNIQPSLPPSRYYKAYNRPLRSRPMNHYSRIVHEIESNGKGYAFSYDDVSPSVAEDQSGFVASGSPDVLGIIVGGS